MKFSMITLLALMSIKLLASGIPNQRIYYEAQKSYNAGEFQKAYEMFETLSEESPANAEINFLLGRSALELKQYDNAAIAFERVLMMNPSHTRTHLELARLYYETSQLELAMKELDIVLQSDIPSSIREVATNFKQRIDEGLSKHQFNVTLIGGIGYDNNANNDIGKKEFLIPSFNIPILGNNKVSDTNIFATMVINHIYDIGDKGDWSIENNFISYSKFNHHITSSNLALFSANVAPTWSFEDYKLAFPVNYDRIYLAGKGYMYNIGVTAKSSYLIDASSQLEGGLSKKQSFYLENDALDIKSTIFFGSYKKAFGEDPIIFSISSSYSNNNELNIGAQDVGNETWLYTLELSKSFKNGFKTSLSYTFSDIDYDKINNTFLTKRSDTRNEYELGVGYSLSKDILLNASINYAKNSSNHDPYNYDKVTALLSAILSF